MKRKKICGIYKITSPTGKTYIGQSVNCLLRITKYKYGSGSQVRLHNSILKYGWGNHKFDIIHVCEPSELNCLEKYYVELFNTFNTHYGLNLREGGGSNGKMSNESRARLSKANFGKKATEETRKRISDGHKGQKAWNKGIPASIEKSLKHSQKMKGKVAWNKGLVGVYSDEVLSKMKNANLGKKHTEETKKKMSEIRKGEKHPMFGKKRSQESVLKMVESKLKLVLNTQTGIFYSGAEEAAATIGMNPNTLRAKLNGHNKNNNTFFIHA